jgi:sulfate transport system substrate-binding protein
MRKLALAAFALTAMAAQPALAQQSLLNVSYDVGRELFVQINEAFIAKHLAATGQTVTIDQSHAGSSTQARAILEGLQADVVTFNQVVDVQILHDRGDLIPADWQSRLPNNSSPFYSLPAFLVRAGNPKNIQDWGDLVRDDVQVVFPNPKTSGNGRYTYLAARAWANREFAGDEAKVNDFLTQLFAHVPVFDTGGRAATATFAERGIGDVLITFEAETRGTEATLGDANYDTVVPSVSLLAEFPVTVVDKVVDARGTRALAEEYLNFLYTPEAQEIIARNFYRVIDPTVAAAHAAEFPEVELVRVEDEFGGWAAVTAEHFEAGGLLDQVFVNQ